MRTDEDYFEPRITHFVGKSARCFNESVRENFPTPAAVEAVAVISRLSESRNEVSIGQVPGLPALPPMFSACGNSGAFTLRPACGKGSSDS
ncbi:hypothetical protein [Streptomyces sp. NPDC045369]|uniref:hypothetical protein n=1 Tax=Streptomyces sp. NPDC045369 TaxID=3155732 RepID=UPI0033E49B18